MPTSKIPDAFRKLLNSPEPPDPGPGPRAGVMSQADLEQRLREALPGSSVPRERQDLIRAALLLWHDHHDASHAISQGVDSEDGSLLHAILHRREPDYWNSKYWFRNVGKHPAYSVIGRQVGEFLQSKGETKLAARLAPQGKWDPFAFVDLCEEIADGPISSERVSLARAIQQIEFEAVLEYLCAG